MGGSLTGDSRSGVSNLGDLSSGDGGGDDNIEDKGEGVGVGGS